MSSADLTKAGHECYVVIMDGVLDFPQWIFALIHAIFLVQFQFPVPDIYVNSAWPSLCEHVQ